MRLIRKKEIKFVKLCLISPYLEQAMNILYLLALPMIAFKFMNFPMHFNNYETNQMARSIFQEDNFREIQNSTMFLEYLDFLTDILYNPKGVPYFMPIGGIRIKKFSIDDSSCQNTLCHSEECLAEFSYTEIYDNCTLLYDQSSETKNITYKFGSENKTFYEMFTLPFEGKYSSYHLINDGQYIDFSYDEYKNNKRQYINFIDDKNIRFIVIMYNVYAVYSKTYLHMMSGIEMLQYFSMNSHILTTTIFFKFDENDSFLFLIYIVFSCSVMVSILKLIYEVNLKFQVVIHIISLLHEAINLSIIIFIMIFLSASKASDLDNTAFLSKSYHNYLPLVSIRNYITFIISLAIFCYPWRIISFYSWFKQSKTLITYLNVLFRMLPGILTTSITFGVILFSYSLILYSIYNEYLAQYSSLLNAIINLFQLNLVGNFLGSKSIIENLSISPVYLLYNSIILVTIVVILILTFSTYIYLFKQAASIEVKKEDNEVMQKISELDEKFEKFASKKKKKSLSQADDLRQIIWLCLTNNNELYNEKSSEFKVLLFTTSNQIISFLKYLFAIKPKMQFKKLDQKFAILIECRTDSSLKYFLKDDDIEQVDTLFDWLNFAGCKIPVSIYSEEKLDRNLRMSISSNYWNIAFINYKKDINKFFNKEKQEIKEILSSDKSLKQNNNTIVKDEAKRRGKHIGLSPLGFGSAEKSGFIRPRRMPIINTEETMNNLLLVEENDDS